MTSETGLTVEQAAANLLAIEDSYEEPTDDAAEDPIEPEEVEPEEIEESDDEEPEADEGEDESDTTPDDESQEPDDRIAKREKELTADYTRKTQALAEERKTFEAEREQTRAERTRYAETITQLEQVLTSLQPPEPDWEALRKADPAEYAAQREDWRRQQEDLLAVRAEKSRIDAEKEAENHKAFESYLETEKAALLAAIPEWSDTAKATAEKTALFEGGAKVYGFKDEDFASVVDHRLVLMLRDALKYREIATKGKEAIEGKKEIRKILQPGAPTASKPKGKEAEIIKLRQKLKETGDGKYFAKIQELLEE